MREPNPTHKLYGVLAEFETGEDLIAATRRTHEAGYTLYEAFSPFPLEGLREAEGFTEVKVPLATLFGGIGGAALGYGMQVYVRYDFPINIGGRPFIASAGFALITFEVMVLCAVVASVLTMLICNRLPRLHHPLFEVERFHMASSDRFFLVIQSNDEKYDHRKVGRFLKSLKAQRLFDVPFAEEPE